MTVLVAGMIAEVSAKIISVDSVAVTATVRVIDNNGTFLSPAVTLPQGVVTPVQFTVALGDVLEQGDPNRRTAVVRWVDATGFSWSESPSGIPARDTIGWNRLGTFPLP